MRKNEISAFRRDMIKAKYAYHQAIAQKLKECGKELEVVEEYWDEEDDDCPKGVHLTTLGDDNNAFDVVVDRIRYEDGDSDGKVAVHICRWEYNEVDYWISIGDLMDECADYVFSSIMWEDDYDPDHGEKLDKRLKLTDEQLKAVNQYNNAVKDLLKSGVNCVFREFDEIGAFNGKAVDNVTFEEDTADGDITIQFDDLMKIECPFGLNLVTNDKAFNVHIDEN